MIATGNRCNSPADRGTKKHVYLPYRWAIPFWFYLVPLRLVRISQITRLPGYEIHEKISLLLIIKDFIRLNHYISLSLRIIQSQRLKSSRTITTTRI